MWKIKQSKYKNAFPQTLKREEWIGDVSANALLNSCGNHIKASSKYIVFNTDVSNGSSLVVLPIDTRGRQDGSTYKYINAHLDYVTDFDFSPCNEALFATCSMDCSVKIWRLPSEINESLSNAEQTIQGFDKRVENVTWNPCADQILAATSDKMLRVYDVTNTTPKYEFTCHEDQVQSAGWKLDGSLIVTSCKDKKLRILDPRSNSVSQEAEGHAGVKDSRAIWCGDRDLVLTTGFDRARQREVTLRDTRMGLKSVESLGFDTASGVLMPLFDPDTNMLFLAGQGDTTLRFLEVNEKDPFLTISCTDAVEQVKGLALVPKAALDVMSGEVNRLMLLGKSSVIPIPCIVPRKSYTEYHGDLFPDTYASEPSMTAEEWCAGQNKERSRVSLDPHKKGTRSGFKAPQKSKSDSSTQKTANSTPAKPTITNKPKPAIINTTNNTPNNDVINSSVTSEGSLNAAQVIMRERKTKAFAGVRQSKFRHLEGSPSHQSKNITNIRNMSHTIPGESDMFKANKTFCAVPLSGSGGLIAILRTENHVRLPDTGIPTIQNGASVMDFAFDPFDDHTLAVACDDGSIRIWKLPEEEFEGTLTEPAQKLLGHTEKVYTVLFHSLAKNVLTSSSQDHSVRIWNLDTGSEEKQLEGHTDTIFGMSWRSDGAQLATVCKDGQIRIYQPRSTHVPIQVGKGLDGTRGGRVVWACQDQYLVVSGFDRMSVRGISIYDASDLKSALFSIDMDTHPSILIPHLDQDTSTLFLCGRGDTTIKAFEVSSEYPHLFELSSVSTPTANQGLAFLPKNELNVKNVEFAKALRLTNNSIEPLSFTVPRVKRDYFQDDIFPTTRVTWEPSMTAGDWLWGANTPSKEINLKPSDMQKLSEAPVEAPKPRKYEDFQQYQATYKTDEEKREELVSAMSQKLGVADEPLPQDLNEGVDSDEWED